MRLISRFLGLLILSNTLYAQAQPARVRNAHEQLFAVVPMAGAGTFEDPRRPLFALRPGETGTPDAPPILSFTYEVSDDGRFALVVFSAADRAAFAHIRASGRADVKWFERGRATKDEIEREFRRFKRDFDAARFAERAQ